MAFGVSTVVEYLLMPKEREKLQIISFRVLKKLYLTIACGSSTVVEHSANHPNVKGSRVALYCELLVLPKHNRLGWRSLPGTSIIAY